MATTPVLLELDLTHGLLETPPADPLAAFRARHTPVLGSLVERLREAAGRDDVAGLVAHVADVPLSDAQVQELGAAIEAFGAAGKPTAAWTEAFGEGGNGTLAYYLAVHFDEIWVQPSGGLALSGVAMQGTFARAALDKIGVQPQVHQRHEYKNAPDTFMRDSMSEAQREAYQRLTDSLVEEISATVARRRGLDLSAVRAAIDDSPLTPTQAKELGLVDHIGYRDEVYASLRRRIAGAGHAETPEADLPEVEQRFVHRWSRPKGEVLRERIEEELARRGSKLARRGKPAIVAVVPVEGGIMLGTSGGSPLSGPTAGSDTITSALRRARQDDDVAAIVLRVVSPGGSYTASDAVHREVALAREAGKPVVASMGTVAASGGYFVAMGADRILALPTTLTGSIGVFAGKVVTEAAAGKLGVQRELVETGERASMWSTARPFTDAELARLDAWLDDVYADFTGKAAAAAGWRMPSSSRSRGAASGRAPTPMRAASSTNSAASSRPSRRRRASPDAGAPISPSSATRRAAARAPEARDPQRRTERRTRLAATPGRHLRRPPRRTRRRRPGAPPRRAGHGPRACARRRAEPAGRLADRLTQAARAARGRPCVAPALSRRAPRGRPPAPVRCCARRAPRS